MRSSPNGSLIFLHGASSSGKSTLARALQATLPMPFWHVSIDHLRDSGVLPMDRYRSGDFDWRADRGAFFAGFHQSVLAFLASGNNVILEHIIETPDWLPQLRSLWDSFDVVFVGVHCSLATLEKREAQRGDRPKGMAAADFARVHDGLRYDVEVNSEASLATNVETIAAALAVRRPRSAFFGRTYFSSSTTLTNSSGRAVVYLIWPMAKDELTSVRLMREISFL